MPEDEVELLLLDRVGDSDAVRNLSADRDLLVGHRDRHRRILAHPVVGERLILADPDPAVERDAQPALATELLVEDAHDLRDGRFLADERALRVRRGQEDARDDAEPDVRRAAGLEEPRLQVQPDAADPLAIDLERLVVVRVVRIAVILVAIAVS
jgi:hypothetical protein